MGADHLARQFHDRFLVAHAHGQLAVGLIPEAGHVRAQRGIAA